MDLFIFIVTSHTPALQERLDAITDKHEIASNVWLVSSPLLVQDLSNQLGVGDVAVGSGVVFRLNGTYWGRTNQNTWDWLARAHSRSA